MSHTKSSVLSVPAIGIGRTSDNHQARCATIFAAGEGQAADDAAAHGGYLRVPDGDGAAAVAARAAALCRRGAADAPAQRRQGRPPQDRRHAAEGVRCGLRRESRQTGELGRHQRSGTDLVTMVRSP